MNRTASDNPETNRTGAGDGFDERGLLAGFVKAFVQTETCAELVQAAAAGVTGAWAGDNKLKKNLSRMLDKGIVKILPAGKETVQEEPIVSFLQSPGFISAMERQLPTILNDALEAAAELFRAVEKAPADEKADLLAGLIEHIDFSRVGEITTDAARIINEIHQADPAFFAGKMEPALDAWIKRTDFGELKEALDNSFQDITGLVASANNVIWQYPAKVVCLFALAPTLLNLLVASLTNTLAPLNRVAPELLADIVSTLVKSIDAGKIGRMLNEINELVRKLHTGSALIGGPNNSLVIGDMVELVADILKRIDIKLYVKMKDALEEIKESFEEMFITALESEPELSREFLRSHFKQLGHSLRMWNREMEAVEDIFDDEDIAREMADVEIQDLADTINRVCAILNGARSRERVAEPMATRFFEALDVYEVGETLKWFTGDVVESVKPLAHEVMPDVIRGVTELIRPDENENNTELREALAEFAKVLDQGGMDG